MGRRSAILLVAAALLAACPPGAARGEDTAALLDQAASDYSSGNYAQAIGEFQRVLAIQPDHLMAHYYLGYLYVRTDQKDLAQKEFLRVGVLDPTGSQGRDAATWLRDNGTPDAMAQLRAAQDAAHATSRAAAADQPRAVDPAERVAPPPRRQATPAPPAPTVASAPDEDFEVPSRAGGTGNPPAARAEAPTPAALAPAPRAEVPTAPAPAPRAVAPAPRPVEPAASTPAPAGPVAVDPPPGDRMVIPGEGLSLVAPTGWQVEVGSLGTKVSFTRPLNDGTRANIDLMVGRYDPDADTLDGTASRLTDALKGAKILEKKDNPINGMPGFFLYYSYQIGRGPLQVEQYVFHRGVRKYVLTYGVIPKHFSQYEDTFRRIALTTEDQAAPHPQGGGLQPTPLKPTPIRHHRAPSTPLPVPEES